jgi:2-polyprenyl-6-methoxyphenol hydroxylase-like FAD-dependent oxidoreductase
MSKASRVSHEPGTPSPRHAVVIGGSLAGLCVARVLADHFERVTVVDRDRFPEVGEHRTGVPQSHHAHALLLRGKRELELLFPGFEAAVLEHGAQKLDFLQSFAVSRKWGWAPRGKSARSLWASRPLLEGVARELAQKHERIHFVEKTTVEGLVVDRAGPLRVAGVRAAHTGGPGEEIPADLVVDASGRGTKAPRWLEALGLPRPDEQVVESYAGYASRFYERPAPAARPRDWWWEGLWIEMEPPDLPRGGVAFPLEGNRWLVTAVGMGKDYPPDDERGFLDFLESLSSPILARAVAHAKPLTDIVINRSTTNRFRHYETWKARLDGFVALGDSVCAFNPLYGQGMSAAAGCSSILRDALREHGPDPRTLPRAFFAKQAAFLKSVWWLASGADFAWPTTEGDRPPGAALVAPYMQLVLEASHSDLAIQRRVGPVFHLVADARMLFSPSMIAAVVRSTILRRMKLRGTPMTRRSSLPPGSLAGAEG